MCPKPITSVQGYMDLLPSELDAKIQEQEQSLAAAQQEVEDALQKLQKDYAEARRRKARWLEMEDVYDVYGKYICDYMCTYIYIYIHMDPPWNFEVPYFQSNIGIGCRWVRNYWSLAWRINSAIVQNGSKNEPPPRLNSKAVKDRGATRPRPESP